MLDAGRMLGFAFAGADLLFEIDDNAAIQFALGAVRNIVDVPAEQLSGQPAGMLFAPADGARFATFAKALGPGGRVGPVKLKLAAGSTGILSMCNLPDNHGRISCALSHAQRNVASFGVSDDATGLNNRLAFLDAARRTIETDSELSLVNIANLADVCAGLSDSGAEALMSRIGETIQSLGVSAAGRLSETCFGVVSGSVATAKKLAPGIEQAARESGVDGLAIEEKLLSLHAENLTTDQRILATRFVIGRFAEKGLPSCEASNINDIFNIMIEETLERAKSLEGTAANGSFDIVFEPVVDLKTGKTSCYDVRPRLSKDEPPDEVICFASEMGIGDAFDLAVIGKTLSVVEKDKTGTFKLAVGISANTIGTPASFAMLTGLLESKKNHAKRILIELSDCSELPDVSSAIAGIQQLRKLGYKVGLTGFGSGSSLPTFDIDFVKVDGSLTSKLGSSAREDTILAGMLQTFAKVGIETIAEKIDDFDLHKRTKDIGFRFGQGRYFGVPMDSIAA